MADSRSSNGTLEQMESRLLRITMSIPLSQPLRQAFSPVAWFAKHRKRDRAGKPTRPPPTELLNLTLLIPPSSNALGDETERDPTGGPFTTFESDPTVPTTLIRALRARAPSRRTPRHRTLGVRPSSPYPPLILPFLMGKDNDALPKKRPSGFEDKEAESENVWFANQLSEMLVRPG
jgi:hypothetical protein